MTITNNAAYEIPCFYIGTLEANVDMSTEATWQYAGVGIAAASGLGLLGPAALVAPAAGGAILGVLQNNPNLAEAGTVMALGISKVKAAGTWVPGDLLKVDATGAFLVATTGTRAVAKAILPGAAGSVSSAYIQDYGLIP